MQRQYRGTQRQYRTHTNAQTQIPNALSSAGRGEVSFAGTYSKCSSPGGQLLSAPYWRHENTDEEIRSIYTFTGTFA